MYGDLGDSPAEEVGHVVDFSLAGQTFHGTIIGGGARLGEARETILTYYRTQIPDDISTVLLVRKL